MKSARAYVMRARAKSAAATRQAILDAAVAELWCRRVGDVRLEAIAARAAVTVQTVLRVFGSRGRLIESAWDATRDRIVAQRETARPGDVEGTVRVLFDHYEELGDFVIRMLAEEDTLPDMRGWLARGRAAHRRTMQTQFAPYLARFPPGARARMLDTLVVACDVYTWKLLRRDMRRRRAEAQACVCRLVNAIIEGG